MLGQFLAAVVTHWQVIWLVQSSCIMNHIDCGIYDAQVRVVLFVLNETCLQFCLFFWLVHVNDIEVAYFHSHSCT